MVAFYVSPSIGRLAIDQHGYDISLSSSIWYPCNMLKIINVDYLVADQHGYDIISFTLYLVPVVAKA